MSTSLLQLYPVHGELGSDPCVSLVAVFDSESNFRYSDGFFTDGGYQKRESKWVDNIFLILSINHWAVEHVLIQMMAGGTSIKYSQMRMSQFSPCTLFHSLALKGKTDPDEAFRWLTPSTDCRWTELEQLGRVVRNCDKGLVSMTQLNWIKKKKTCPFNMLKKNLLNVMMCVFKSKDELYYYYSYWTRLLTWRLKTALIDKGCQIRWVRKILLVRVQVCIDVVQACPLVIGGGGQLFLVRGVAVLWRKGGGVICILP